MKKLIQVLTAASFIFAAFTGCDYQCPNGEQFCLPDPRDLPGSDDAVFCDYAAPFGGELCDGYSVESGTLQFIFTPDEDPNLDNGGWIELEVEFKYKSQETSNDWTTAPRISLMPTSRGGFALTSPDVPSDGDAELFLTEVYLDASGRVTTTTRAGCDGAMRGAVEVYETRFEGDAGGDFPWNPKEDNDGRCYIDINF